MTWEDFALAFFSLDILRQAWPILLSGLVQTLLLSLMVVPLGLAGGVLLALLSTARSPWVRWPLVAWVDVFRALPPLVLLVFVYAGLPLDRKSTRLNSSHANISYAVFCLKKKKKY